MSVVGNSTDMNVIAEYLSELNSEINDLEQISSINKRLSEEKILTRHLVQQVRTLMQIVQLQQEGREIDVQALNVNYI